MRCLVSAKALKKRLVAVSAVLPRRTFKPILETVRFEVDDKGRGTFAATDLETWIRIRSPILRATRPGAVLIPVKALNFILDAISGEVELDADPDSFALGGGPNCPTCPLVVSSGGSRSVLPTYRPEDFPARDEPACSGHHELLRTEIVRLIRTTAFAAVADDPRYQLGGCWFGLNADSVDVVATDGYRLAYASRQAVRVVGSPIPPILHVPGDRSKPLAAVVEAKPLRLLARLLEELGGPLAGSAVYWTASGSLCVETDGLSFASRQLEGRFPEWRKGLPSPSPHRGHFSRSDRLLSVLKQAQLLADRDRERVRVRLRPGGLTLSVRTTGGGEASFEVYCDCRSEPRHAEFRPSHLIEALAALGGESVDIELNGPGEPGVIHATGFRYCVMSLGLDGPVASSAVQSEEDSPEDASAAVLGCETVADIETVDETPQARAS